MSDSIKQWDIGTPLRLWLKDSDGTALPLQTATSIKMIFLKPETGACVQVDAEFVTDGSDGGIQYVTVEGFLDQHGWWLFQGVVTTTLGNWASDEQSFEVEPRLCTPAVS